MFDVLSKLQVFSIPLDKELVIAMYVSQGSGMRILQKRQAKKALSQLHGRWLKVEGDIVYCHESRLTADKPEGQQLASEAKLITDAIEATTKKKRRQTEQYYLLGALAHALHKFDMYKEALSCYERLEKLPDSMLPEPAQKVRSNLSFYRGHALYLEGRAYWAEARRCYKISIKLDENNLFAKHALAMLNNREGNAPEAIRILSEITNQNPKDIIALQSKLDILTKTGSDDREAQKTFKQISRLLQNEKFTQKEALSGEFGCVKYSEAYGKELKDKGETEKADRRLEKTVLRYESLLEKIPPELNELAGIVRNSYGCFLYDVLEWSDTAIVELESSVRLLPNQARTLYKLASIYLEESERRSKDKPALLESALTNLGKVIEMQPENYRARLLLARIEGEKRNWTNIQESDFWHQASKVYHLYDEAFEREVNDVPSLHNSVVHHARGCFLWHIEAKAYIRQLQQSRPGELLSADVELEKSTEIETKLKEPFPSDVRHHLVLANFTLGSYYVTLKRGSSNSGRELIKKAMKLGETSQSKVRFSTQNSYVACFIGRLLLANGEVQEAKNYLADATVKYKRNWRAWWFLGGIYEMEGNYGKAIELFEKSADGERSPGLYGQLRGIIKDWIDNRKVSSEYLKFKLKYSKQAYELDREGRYSAKNISDYGYDLFLSGSKPKNKATLNQAKDLLEAAYKRYLAVGDKEGANFPMWFMGRIHELLRGSLDKEALMCYVESAVLSGKAKIYDMLKEKVWDYCLPIWRSGRTVDDELAARIVAAATLHREFKSAQTMIHKFLPPNRENQ